MTSIIRTESKFDQKAVSRTGDISLVQINPGTWDHAEWLRIRGYNKKQVDSMLVKIKENPALGKEIFDLERLPKDSAYAIERFGEILSYLKKTYSKNDKFWYARYHSSTCNEIKCPKLDYAKTVNSYYKEMNTHLEKEFKNKLAQISSDIKELKTNPNINIAVLEAFESELKMLNKVKHVGKNRMVAQN